MGKDGNEEASGLDKLLTLFPSTPQAGKPGGTGKDEDTASEADYKCNEIKDSASESGKAEDAAATPQSANVDVHNLFAQLLGAGLVKGDDGEKAKDGKAAVIPGLEVKNSEPSAKDKKKDKAKAGEEDKGGAEEGESEEEKKKKEEEERKRKEEEQRKAKELEIQPITLQSHDPSLKQRQVRERNIFALLIPSLRA